MYTGFKDIQETRNGKNGPTNGKVLNTTQRHTKLYKETLALIHDLHFLK